MDHKANESRTIIFVIYSPFPRCTGGRESWLHNISDRIKADRDITIISLASRATPQFALDETGIRFISAPSLRYFPWLGSVLGRLSLGIADLLNMALFTLFVTQWLVRNAPANAKIVSMHSHIDFLPVILAKKLRKDLFAATSVRGRVLHRLRMEGKVMRSWFFHKLENALLTRADLVLTNGYDTQVYVGRVRKDSIVIPNGVDVGHFSSEGTPREEDSRSLEKFRKEQVNVILSVATLRDVKGIRQLIQCSAIIARSKLNFVIIFVGKGNANRYEKLASGLGVRSHIFFWGQRKSPELPILYRKATITACLSGGGGMSITTLEAMAAGSTIVAWNTDTYQQLLQEERTAILVEDQNLDALATAIIRLMDDSELRRKLSSEVQKDVEKFDWLTIKQKFLESLSLRP